MHFEVSERLITNEPPEAVMEFAQRQFAKISSKTRLERGQLTVRMVEASFGSINRSDVTRVTLQRVGGGHLLVSETDYQPSVWFWLFLIILLFTYIGWLIPNGFYLYQRSTVRSAIQSAISRVVNEFSVGAEQVGVPTADVALKPTFEDLFACELPGMLRLAVGLVDIPERAEEIVQDAFEKTLIAWGRLREPGAYLRTAVVNGCKSELRRRRVRRRHPDPRWHR